MTTARITQPAAELEDEGAVVVVVTGWVVDVVVAWGWLVVVTGGRVVEVVVAVVGGTVVVGGAVVVVAGGKVVVVVCAAGPPADSPRAKRTAANTAKSPAHVAVRRNMVVQPRDRAPSKRGTVAVGPNRPRAQGLNLLAWSALCATPPAWSDLDLRRATTP
jgi:hypothetical protein